ncbi:FemAB family XrtA/PEP-CTERM system-associated protein [Desulfonatronovibrio hydrogenovorans]|uniref:FemAB family XrtA/PEP-CTERM system-associated protein n=1 Tax=Desulfonatronovibrio hydrogenovorans TaxID=53245 RepID=UPI00068D65DE|nr:FemAB family XrtA/PEP-CTERM system-associated protein [Desulfonatronovibrio hydrogenovorans]
MLKSKLYSPEYRSMWDEYVDNHFQGSLFHTRLWQETVKAVFGHSEHSIMLLDNKDGRPVVKGLIPLFRIRSFLFGDYLVSVPFAEQGGPLADHESLRIRLVDLAGEKLKKNNLDYLEMRNVDPLPDLLCKDLYYGFQREILSDLEDNLMAIPRKSRRMVRQGMKNNLQIAVGSHLLPEFYAIMARNFHGLGTPIFPYSWFSGLMESFQENCLLLLVKDEKGNHIAGVMSFFYKNRVMPYYAGSLVEYRNLAPNDFMYWKLMEYAWEKGSRIFDFGRSKIGTGSFRFKTHWGFEPRSLAYQYVLHKKDELPDLSPNNPKYQSKIKTWQRMPLSLTKIIGPRISRYLC